MIQPLHSERALLLTLAGIQFSHVLDFMIMMPLGPILMSDLGITTHQFGLLVASYSFNAAVSGLLGATFVDRFERNRLLLIIFLLFGLSTYRRKGIGKRRFIRHARAGGIHVLTGLPPALER